MTKIGYNDGILGLVAWVRKVSLGTVKFRPLAERPANHSEWSWLENLERTLRILKDDHDAAVVGPTPGPAPPPPPPTARLAPQSYNKGSRGQDARYCLKDFPGLIDGGGFAYDADGRSLGGRSGKWVPGLKPSDEMDGRGPCEPDGAGHPPYPPESYEV